jgi:4-hydroxybenzoate polyprenyltransferase
MVAPESVLVWRYFARAIIWGKRGLIKSNALWLPLAVLLTKSAYAGERPMLVLCFQIFLTVACWSSASILANDLADRQRDRAAGKQRWICYLPKGVGVLILAVLFGLGAGLVVICSGKASASLSYGGAVALGLLYSIKPVRFKERGIWGLLAYSLSGTFAYVIMPWAWVGSGRVLLLILAPAVLLDKWVNLHFHQVIDYGADRTTQTRTHTAVLGLEQGRRLLKYFTAFAAVSLLTVLVYIVLLLPLWRMVILLAAGIIILAGALYTKVSRQRPDRASLLLRELSSLYLGLTYAVFRILPLILFVRLALGEPTIWIVVGAVALLMMLESWYAVRYRYE